MPSAAFSAPLEPTRPFTRQEALRAGLTDDVLRGPRFGRLVHGIYIDFGVEPSLETAVDAALLRVPDGVVSHATAAELRGLPVPSASEVHLTVPTAGRRMPGIRIHPGGPDTVEFRGRRLSTATANFGELATSRTPTQLVIVGDAMVRRGFVTAGALVEAMAAHRGRRVRAARAAAALVRPRVDSPKETEARLLIVSAGLPEPTTVLVIRDEWGGWVAEVDLGYAKQRVAIEYDGDLHRTSRKKRRGDVAKRELLRQMGWVVIVLTADDLSIRRGFTIDRIAAALRPGRR